MSDDPLAQEPQRHRFGTEEAYQEALDAWVHAVEQAGERQLEREFERRYRHGGD